jgi:ParB-like chromosome segregation protein Spo0J
MIIENLPIENLIPYIRNPRKNENTIEKVASSIKEFGFRQPIVVDAEKVIIAGHTRYEAAKRLQLSKVPVHVAKGLTEQQVKAYRIADILKEINFEPGSQDEQHSLDELNPKIVECPFCHKEFNAREQE